MDLAAAAVWISLAACLTSVVGLFSRRERYSEQDALWRGEVNGKLDVVCGIKQDVEALKSQCQQNAKEIAVVDASARSAHHRIDELAQTGRRGRKEENA